jgi:hypothetical protein
MGYSLWVIGYGLCITYKAYTPGLHVEADTGARNWPQLLRKLNLTIGAWSGIMYPEGRGKTSLGTPARDLLAPPLKTKRGSEMEYNEFDDYGTGWEEAAERALELIEAEALDSCRCEKAGTIEAYDALLAGRCVLCGWNN